MRKCNITEFANKIRKKYPNSYNDLSDNELVKLWVKKYPDDGGYIINENTNSLSLKWPLIIILGVILFLTNPSLSKHKVAVANEGMGILKETKLDGIFELFGGGEEFTENLFKSSTKRQNYFFFSLTEFDMGEDYGGSNVIGIGALGYVYIFPQVREEILSQIGTLKSGAGLFFGK
jgi:hypothetical protein